MASGILYAGTGVGGTVFRTYKCCSTATTGFGEADEAPAVCSLHHVGLAQALLVQGVDDRSRQSLSSALLDAATDLLFHLSQGVGYGIAGSIAISGIKPRLPIARGANASHRRARVNWSFLQRSPIYSFVTAIMLTSLGNVRLSSSICRAWLLSPDLCAWPSFQFVPTVWLASYASEIKSKPDGATLVAIMNAASVFGLLGFGILSDKLPTRVVIVLTAGGAALASIFLWGFAGRSSALLVVFSLFFGATGLAFTALWSRLITIISRA